MIVVANQDKILFAPKMLKIESTKDDGFVRIVAIADNDWLKVESKPIGREEAETMLKFIVGKLYSADTGKFIIDATIDLKNLDVITEYRGE